MRVKIKITTEPTIEQFIDIPEEYQKQEQMVEYLNDCAKILIENSMDISWENPI